MKKLKHFCDLFEYGGAQDSLPYTFSLFTAFIVDRKIEIVEEGFHEFANFNVCNWLMIILSTITYVDSIW